MTPFLVSPDITLFIGARRGNGFFEGYVNLHRGVKASRLQHICIRRRDTRDEALQDAQNDVKALIEMLKQKYVLR